jgi:hypothetical protein
MYHVVGHTVYNQTARDKHLSLFRTALPLRVMILLKNACRILVLKTGVEQDPLGRP